MELPRKLENGPVEGNICVEVAGRWFGPFEERSDALGWSEVVARAVSSGRYAIVTARDIYEGSVGYEEARLLNPFAAGFNMHPWIEVWDIDLRHDNGRVLFDLPASTAALPPETAVIVSNPEFGRAPERRLPNAVDHPAKIDLEKGDVIGSLSKPHPAGGEMVVAAWRQHPGLYLCCWRRDGRMVSGLRAFSAHSSPEFAAMALKRAAEGFRPAANDLSRGVSRRAADRQRELVYCWEASIDKECAELKDLDACRAYVSEIYAEIGESGPPAVSLGRPGLERSYYSGLKGIVLAHDSLNTVALLHESGHELAQRECRRRRISEPGHGPVFVGVMMALYARLAGADPDLMQSEAESHTVSWDEQALRCYAAPSCDLMRTAP